jgi:hypothetical protein
MPCLVPLLQNCFTKVNELKEHLALVKRVIHFVKDHQMPLSIFREFSHVELILPGETRYASAVVTVLLATLSVLTHSSKLFASQKYKDWHKNQGKALREESDELKKVVNDAAVQRKSAEIVESMHTSSRHTTSCAYLIVRSRICRRLLQGQ